MFQALASLPSHVNSTLRCLSGCSITKRHQYNEKRGCVIKRVFTLSIDVPQPKTPQCIHALQYNWEPHSLLTCWPASWFGTRTLTCKASSVYVTRSSIKSILQYISQGLAQPPATSTHSARHEPCFPSTSTISVSHLHLHPTPFSFTGSHESQYSSSSFRFFSSNVVFSRNGDRGIWRAGAFAGQCWIVVCR